MNRFQQEGEIYSLVWEERQEKIEAMKCGEKKA